MNKYATAHHVRISDWCTCAAVSSACRRSNECECQNRSATEPRRRHRLGLLLLRSWAIPLSLAVQYANQVGINVLVVTFDLYLVLSIRWLLIYQKHRTSSSNKPQHYRYCSKISYYQPKRCTLVWKCVDALHSQVSMHWSHRNLLSIELISHLDKVFSKVFTTYLSPCD